MYGAFKETKKFLQRKPKFQDPRPDNFVFRLHYQYTFGILAIACLLVTSYSYIDSAGSAIQCMNGGDKTIVKDSVLNKYCWISSTFTLPKHFEGTLNQDFIHHGVGPAMEDDEKIYHQYYQWVPLVLSLQAAMFYLPHWIWKQLEGGRLELIIAGLNMGDCDDTDKKIRNLSNYMIGRRSYKQEHQTWAAKFYLCEVLNFVNVIFQIIFTDYFLGHSFSDYGIEAAKWASQDSENRVDPMSKVFPRMTKCTFFKFGSSGTIQNVDALCVLGMNIINEKIFVFLWFWYIFLALVTGGNIVYRLVTVLMPNIRGKLIKLEEFGFRMRPSPEHQRKIEQLLTDSTYSDWLIIYYLVQCMDKKNFAKLINQMSDIEDEVDSKAVKNKGDESSGVFGCFSDLMPKKMRKNVPEESYSKTIQDDATLPLRRKGGKEDDEIEYQESVTNFHRNANTDV